MVDGSVPAPSALYPQPAGQQPQGVLTGDPTKLIGMLGQLQDYQTKKQEFQIRQQQAPALAQQPAAALAGQNIANASSQQDMDAKALAIAGGAYGSIANSDSPTSDNVHSITTWLSTATHIPSAHLNAIGDMILNDPEGIKKGAAKFQAWAMGPGNASARTDAPPGPGGVPQSMPLGAATVAGTLPTGLPPGSGDYLGASAKAATDLEGTALTSPDNRANLTNLQQDLRVLGTKSGPLLQTEKHVNTVLARFGANYTMSSDELAAADAADKIANQISTQQSKALGGNTDQGRAMVLGSTPNTSMSALGNQNMSAMLLGNQDAIDTQRREWMKDKKAQNLPQNSFLDWQQNTFFPKVNPRVFQFERLPGDAQQKFISQMTPQEAMGFDRDYQAAVQRGWIKGTANAPGR
jgi:hypothetical protein